jgi:hypothetical protein
MQFTKFGQTGLTVSRMILGTGTAVCSPHRRRLKHFARPVSVIARDGQIPLFIRRSS